MSEDEQLSEEGIHRSVSHHWEADLKTAVFGEKQSSANTSGSHVIPECHQQNHELYPRPATAEEIQTLPHVMMKIPRTTWLLVFTGSAMTFARLGVSTPFQNYIQNPPGNPRLPGALGLGEERATIITNVFQLFVFFTPLPLGILSDAWLGRYRTMVIGLAISLLGYILLLVTALPVPLQHGAGLGGLIASMVLIGLGQGALSAVMFPFIGDQIPEHEPTVVQKPDDKLVVVDREITIQFVFNVYFWGGNLGSLSLIATTFLERSSFWSAYLMPTGVLAISTLPLILWSSQIVRPSLQRNVVPQALRVLLIACRNRFRLSAADPLHQGNVPWNPSFVDELRRGLKACQVMILFIVFWLCYSQTSNNIISQAGQMKLIGISNDTIGFLNVLAVVVLSPAIQGTINLLRRKKISFGPIRRITVAFILAAVALGYTAGLQALIYSRPPCYSYPLVCPAAYEDGRQQPNQVNVWLQAPIYVLLAASEILGYVSMTEYAYAEAPANMKAIVQALSQLTVALGFALGIALAPVSRNPWLVVLYGCLAGAMGLSAAIFWVIFRKRDEAYETQQEGSQSEEQSEAQPGSKTISNDNQNPREMDDLGVSKQNEVPILARPID